MNQPEPHIEKTAEWAVISRLFNEALEKDSTERERFLAELPTDVRHEVESLLMAHAESEEFLETSPLHSGYVLTVGQGHDVYRENESYGDFRILRRLGSGSFATVYLARQISLDRDVALKASANFGEEARNMAPLEHDNIVRVFSQTVDGARNSCVICMQYVPGIALDKCLAALSERKIEELSGRAILEVIDASKIGETPFNPHALQDREKLAKLNYEESCLWIAWQVADALAYAHERGVLHLDVKPGNILLSPYGRPMLSDFNTSSRDASETSVFGGTFDFMSPEQQTVFDTPTAEARKRVTFAADVYSLGRVLEEMLKVGKKELSGSVAGILRRCLHPDVSERFSSASLLADALESSLEIRAMERKLPRAEWLTRIAEKHPLSLLLFLILAPQVLASVVNISYNSIRIASALTPAQQAMFQKFCLIYNAFSYPLCTIAIVWLLLPIARFLRYPGDRDAESLALLRKRTLRVPDWLVAVCIFGWMPGSFLFPLAIDLAHGPLAREVYGHFFIDFTLCCLLAMTYSFLYTHFVILRVIYPRLWTGSRDIQTSASRELAGSEAKIRVFQLMAVVVPLFGAAIIVLIGPGMVDPLHQRVYRLLLFLLLGIAMGGASFALRSAGLVGQTLFALTGRSQRRAK